MTEINEKLIWSLADQTVRNYSRKVLSGLFSNDDLDDIVQDVFIKAWENRDKYDESRGALSTWVGIIAKNAVRDAAAKEKRRRSIFSSNPLVENFGDDDADDDNCRGGSPMGVVPVSSVETDAEIIASDTERHYRSLARTKRESRIIDGMINGLDSDELAKAEGIPTKRIYAPVCLLRKRLRDDAA